MRCCVFIKRVACLPWESARPSEVILSLGIKDMDTHTHLAVENAFPNTLRLLIFLPAFTTVASVFHSRSSEAFSSVRLS